MDKLVIRYKDNVHVQVFTDSGIEAELQEHFSFLVPGYQFMPKYKMKMWDGKIRLYNRMTKELYFGLLPKLFEFCENRNYEYIFEESIELEDQYFDEKFILNYFNELKLPFEPRDYQIQSVLHSIRNNRALLVSPTGSGKSLMIYTLTRFYDLKTLIIVPTIGLVTQMQSDFKQYSVNDKGFNVDDSVHCIFAGQDKQTDKKIVISTWQSIYKMPKKYFDQYDVIIGDEVHQFKAQSLVNIMEKLTEAKYRFGTTGTLNDSLTHQLVLQGLFGDPLKVTTTKKLMDENNLSELNVNCLILKYNDETCKSVKNLKYHEEIAFILKHEKRNNFIRNLSIKMEGNTMVLFQYVDKHGKLLYELIRKKLEKEDPERKVFFVAGETDKDVREDIRTITESESNAIIVASTGVFSTGINIKNLENIIFASPSKSRIKVLQSIGRVLRIGRSDKANLYDICDDLSYKSYKNFALKHFLERVKIYTVEKFKYKIVKMDIESE
jgi:superfamily II DNA or RNA helicase